MSECQVFCRCQRCVNDMRLARVKVVREFAAAGWPPTDPDSLALLDELQAAEAKQALDSDNP